MCIRFHFCELYTATEHQIWTFEYLKCSFQIAGLSKLILLAFIRQNRAFKDFVFILYISAIFCSHFNRD